MRKPTGFAAFGTQAIGNNVYVTYAKQDADEAATTWPARVNGFVDVFSTSKSLIMPLAVGAGHGSS